MNELKQMVQLIRLELAAEHEKKQAIKAAWQDEVRQKVSLVEQITLLQAGLQNVRAAKAALAKAQAVAKALLSPLFTCRSSTEVG